MSITCASSNKTYAESRLGFYLFEFAQLLTELGFFVSVKYVYFDELICYKQQKQNYYEPTLLLSAPIAVGGGMQ